MKKISSIVIAAFFLSIPFLSFGQQETPTNENNNSEKKISYTFINEYGFFVGGGFGFTSVFVNGISIKKQDIIGIGVGYESDDRSQQSIPIFLNYRHYFSGKRVLKPLVNFAVGTRISLLIEDYSGWYIYGTPMGDTSGKNVKVTPGLYATIAAGFKVKAFSFTSGFFLKSCNNDFFGGVEVKVGYTF
ncbi:MAG: hypothetical protein FWF65_05375 [Bacteroidetes bacterium]|nr:hypothetical protein [Bacteroidota bacterium]